MVENTYLLPWCHCNTLQEFVFGIINDKREDSPFYHLKLESDPVAAFLNGPMATHAPGKSFIRP